MNNNIIIIKKERENFFSLSIAYLIELEFSARTSIFSFEKDRYVLYLIVAHKNTKNPIINAIKALPRYFIAKTLMLLFSNFITPFLAKFKLRNRYSLSTVMEENCLAISSITAD